MQGINVVTEWPFSIILESELIFSLGLGLTLYLRHHRSPGRWRVAEEVVGGVSFYLGAQDRVRCSIPIWFVHLRWRCNIEHRILHQ